MKPLLLILSLMAAGCASNTTSESKATSSAPAAYQPSGATALAFEPPIASAQPLPSFDRAGRAPEAFAGYEDSVTTYSYTQQRDDIRVYGDYGRLERRAFTDRTSVTHR